MADRADRFAEPLRPRHGECFRQVFTVAIWGVQVAVWGLATLALAGYTNLVWKTG